LILKFRERLTFFPIFDVSSDGEEYATLLGKSGSGKDCHYWICLDPAENKYNARQFKLAKEAYKATLEEGKIFYF
jgi:hypothetical protein